MIPLTKYKNIKDLYCIGYYGHDEITLTQLRHAILLIEQQLPGIKIIVCCEDEELHRFDRVIPKSIIAEKAKNKDFAYFRLIKDREVKFLLDESNIFYNSEIIY